MQPVIGLFGTVRGSHWRDPFVARYEAEGIGFFNPKKKGWSKDDAAIETRHMLEDDAVVVFAVTEEAHGFNPLAEIGWAAMAVATAARERHLAVYIDPKVSAALHAEHEPSASGAEKCRVLVASHLRGAQRLFPQRIHMVGSLEELLEASVRLYRQVGG